MPLRLLSTSERAEARDAESQRGSRLSAAPAISVCILAYRGLENLEACLATLRSQSTPPAFELLIGGVLSEELVTVVQRYFRRARLCDTRHHLPGAARNVLIAQATGELLLFLDDDVTVPPELLRRLTDTAARHPGASVFGGPNGTPPDSSRFQVTQGAVLSSLAGSGPVSRRYGARRPGFADERWFTLCNLAVRREVMVPFVSELVCAEENELLAKLRRRGEPMLYDPSLSVFHVRRASWRSFARQMFKYGRGRGQVLARRPRTVRAAFLAPAAFLLYLLLVPMIAVGAESPLVLLVLAAYAAVVSASSAWIAWTLRRTSAAPVALVLTMTIHLCYGAGVLRGLLRAFRPRRSTGSETTAPVRWLELGIERQP